MSEAPVAGLAADRQRITAALGDRVIEVRSTGDDVEVVLADFAAAHSYRLPLEAAGYRRDYRKGEDPARQLYRRGEGDAATCLYLVPGAPPPRPHVRVGRRLILAALAVIVASALAVAGYALLVRYDEVSRGPDGLPDRRPLRAADLAPISDAHLRYPGAVLIASSAVGDVKGNPVRPGHPAFSEERFQAAAEPGAIVAWYRAMLAVRGWREIPSGVLEPAPAGETDVSWHRGRREYLDLRASRPDPAGPADFSVRYLVAAPAR
ncbi:MAG: hypothetical protein NVS9B1_14290 [Candidatus Dormibacteraceae bacterium]